MKRILTFLLASTLLLLAACNASDNTGNSCTTADNGNRATAPEAPDIHGSQDAPDAEKLQESNETENQNTPKASVPIRMIMIGTDLYYDTGEASKLTPRCGTLDNHIQSYCAENEIPTKHGMANFKAGTDHVTGWQTASGSTVEIPIDGEWMIFRKLCTDIRDNNKCERITGTSQRLRFYGSETGESVTVPVEYGCVYNWGITLSSGDITPTGITLLIIQSGGTPTGELQTGTAFSLDRYNGKFWESVPYANGTETPVWNALAYLIKKDTTTELRLDWEYLYGTLPSGRYRVSKSIMDFRVPGGYDEHVYYHEFEIGICEYPSAEQD